MRSLSTLSTAMMALFCLVTTLRQGSAAPVERVERWHTPCGRGVKVELDAVIETPQLSPAASTNQRIEDIGLLWDKVIDDIVPMTRKLETDFVSVIIIGIFMT